MKKVIFKKDKEFLFYDSTQSFIHSKVTCKKGLEIEVSDIVFHSGLSDEDITLEIDFSKYDRNLIDIEIIQESENDINDVEELRNIWCFIDMNRSDDSIEIEEVNMMYKGIEIGITEYGTHFIKDKAGNIRLFKKEKYVKQYIDRYCTDGYIDSKKLKVMIMSD